MGLRERIGEALKAIDARLTQMIADAGHSEVAKKCASSLQEHLQPCARLVSGRRADFALKEKAVLLGILSGLRNKLSQKQLANSFSDFLGNNHDVAESLAAISSVMKSINQSEVELERELVKLYSERSVEQAAEIESAASKLSTALDDAKLIDRCLEQARDATKTIEGIQQAAENVKLESESAAAEIVENLSKTTSMRDKVTASCLYAEASAQELDRQARSAAELAQSASERLKSSEDSLLGAQRRLEATDEKLKAAIEVATRLALASEFDTQRKSLVADVWISRILMILSWGGVAALGIWRLQNGGIDSWPKLVASITPMIALGFLGWTFGESASWARNVLEDYRYKAAVAKTFEAYRREVAATDDTDLLRTLLERVITQIGENPTRLNKNALSPNTPLGAVTKSVADVANQVSEAVKAARGKSE